VVLALPAPALAGAAARLAAAYEWRGRVVLHTSGASPDALLSPLRRRGAAVGRLHPLRSFPGRAAAPDALRGIWFALSGDTAAIAAGRRLARQVGGKSFLLRRGEEAAHHLSAVFASNLVVALVAEAAALAPRLGASPRTALRRLGPLLRGTVHELEAGGVARALTGPVARGDAEAIAGQLNLLRGRAREIYRLLSLAALDLASPRLSQPRRAAVRRALRPAPR
jgi:predicted short-subunit dehydrogenase-like oxidoreductase (DUF2520 family)